MKKIILYGKSDGKKLNWEKPVNVKNLPHALSKYGRYKATIEKFVPGKSRKQLGYYRAGILPFITKELLTDTGMTKEEWHKFLKKKFGIKKTIREIMEERGIDITVEEYVKLLCNSFNIKEHEVEKHLNTVVSHSKYTEKQMSIYIDQVLHWMLHFFNLHVPPPIMIEEYI